MGGISLTKQKSQSRIDGDKKQKVLLLSIVYLRVIATILITNSHFSNIWPISAMASGGLLGDILFFAISGYCLFSIKENFAIWYLKRIIRIYPSLILFTLFTALYGGGINDFEHFVKLFIFPTNYIFLIWLLICYIGLYVVAYLSKRIKNFLEITFVSVFIIQLIWYLIFFDKSFYHIDNVSNPSILFLFFNSMLLGALFKKGVIKNCKTSISVVLLIFSTLVYFLAKILFSKIQEISFLQIVNQYTAMILLFFLFNTFMALERHLNKLPCKINKFLEFLSKLTLQIYVVQFFVIKLFEELIFPLNLITTIVGIFILATLVYFIDYYAKKLCVKILKNKSR